MSFWLFATIQWIHHQRFKDRFGNFSGNNFIIHQIHQGKDALQIRPDFAEAHYYLGVALTKMPGRMAEALSHLEGSLRLKPDAELRQLVDGLRAER